MNELIDILREIFPDADIYPVSGIQYGIILRQPYGYYKIYEKGTNYEIRAFANDESEPHVSTIPRQFIADYFRQLEDQ